MKTSFQEFPETLEARCAELDAARTRLLAEIARVRPSLGAAADGTWSLAQLVYHLHLAEKLTARGLEKQLASGQRGEPASVARLREEWERIRTVVGGRQEKWAAPARVVPDGAPDLDRSLELLTESRAALLRVANAPERDLISIYLPHPFAAVGTLAGVSWMSAIAFHELRHLEQVREMIAGNITAD